MYIFRNLWSCERHMEHLKLSDDLQKRCDWVMDRLSLAVADKHAAWRTMNLSTVSVDGGPDARTVVLRGFDRRSKRLWIYTDGRAGKVVQLASNPRACATLWDPRHSVQLRLWGEASVRPAGPEVTRLWQAVPEAAWAAYGSVAVPGTPVAHPDDVQYAPQAAAQNFCVIDLQLQAWEALWLERPANRRIYCQQSAAADWSSEWRVP
jgi:pyridoxamine 5'-phosphate oxidase